MQHPPARPWPVALLTRGLISAAGLGVSAFNRVIRASAPDPSFFDPAGFPWVRDVEASYPDLRRECLQAVADMSRVPAIEDIAGDSSALPGAGQWRALLLMAGGLTVPTNVARLPATHAALRRIPGATTALLSILAPGVHLPRHTGTFAGTLRYHLGLLVPPGGRCRIQVDDEVRTWKEGAASSSTTLTRTRCGTTATSSASSSSSTSRDRCRGRSGSPWTASRPRRAPSRSRGAPSSGPNAWPAGPREGQARGRGRATPERTQF